MSSISIVPFQSMTPARAGRLFFLQNSPRRTASSSAAPDRRPRNAPAQGCRFPFALRRMVTDGRGCRRPCFQAEVRLMSDLPAGLVPPVEQQLDVALRSRARTARCAQRCRHRRRPRRPRMRRRAAGCARVRRTGCRRCRGPAPSAAAEQAQHICHRRARLAHAARRLLLRQPERVDQVAVARRLLDGVQIGALQILDQRNGGRRLVRRS